MHVVSSLELGGQERVILDLAHNLYRRNYRVTIISFAHGGALHGKFGEIPVISLARDAGFDLSLSWRLLRMFRDLRVDVVHTHNPAALIYGVPAARLAGVTRVVHTKHGVNPAANWPGLMVRRALIRMCDAYVAVSEPTAEVARQQDLAPRRVLHTIPNGIDTRLYRHNDEHRREIRRELGVSGEALVIGTVGRLAVEKNQGLLIEAAAPYLSDEIRLVIVGDGPERAALLRRIPMNRQRFVHILGAREDVPAVLSALDIFVLSSSSEGLPLVIPEAMAAGLPVIATSVGGLPEAIRDGRTGRLVPPGDSARLSSAIGELIEKPQLRRALGEEAVRDARARFDTQRMLKSYEQLYR